MVTRPWGCGVQWGREVEQGCQGLCWSRESQWCLGVREPRGGQEQGLVFCQCLWPFLTVLFAVGSAGVQLWVCS